MKEKEEGPIHKRNILFFETLKNNRFLTLFLAATRCLKITEKVSFNNTSERSELRLHFEWTKVHFGEFLKT